MVIRVEKLISSDMLHVFNASKINTIGSGFFVVVGTDNVIIYCHFTCKLLVSDPSIPCLVSSGNEVFHAYLQRVILADLIKK